jgi:hypothetical protein
MADIDDLPIRTAGGAAIQLRLRRVAAFPAAEHAVGAVFFSSAQAALVQHRPDQEANARLFRPVAGPRLFRVFVGLDCQLRDDLGHGGPTCARWARCRVPFVRYVQLVVHAARLGCAPHQAIAA